MTVANASPRARAFVAVELPDEVREKMRDVRDRLRSAIGRGSWARPENFHVTLRFLGTVGEDVIESFASKTEPQFARIAPFPLRVQGVGAFPNLRRASVLWVGAVASDNELASVYRIAEQGAVEIGLPAEARPFEGHITLARFKDRGGRDVTWAIESAGEFDAGEFTARSAALFASTLSPSGAVYTRLREFPFRGHGVSSHL